MKSKIHAITVEPSKNGAKRFVLNLVTDQGHVFFSASLSTPKALMIARSQLRNAIPVLMSAGDPIFAMLTSRSKFIGTTVEIEIVPQMKNGEPVINAETGEPYTNVRLTPDNSDMSVEQALALMGTTAVTSTIEEMQDLES